jgi:voltage-gated potassium channel
MTEAQRPHETASYQLFMLTLSLFALGVISVQVTLKLDPEVEKILDYADYLVCILFFTDFLISLWYAPNRWRYLYTWGWLDLLSSIPVLDATRWGRVARIVRILRVLRALRAANLLASAVLRHRSRNAFLAVSLLAVVLITFSSIAILQFETTAQSNIKTAEDAFWWATVTITTVGYGDFYPVTPEGRLVAVILMGSGVGLFGTFSGLLAARFIGPEVDPSTESDIGALRVEIAALRRQLEAQRGN